MLSMFLEIKKIPAGLFRLQSGIDKKFTNFSRFIEFNQTHPLGFFNLFNHESGHWKSLRSTSEGLQDHFLKSSTLYLDVDITYLGVFRFQEVDFDHKKCKGDQLGVYSLISPIISTLAHRLKIAYFAVLKYQEVSSDYIKQFGGISDGQHVDFHKNFNFIP